MLAVLALAIALTPAASLDTIATRLAGHPATVTCGGPDPGRTWAENGGWAYVGGDRAGLDLETCAGLELVRRHRATTTFRARILAANAIFTFGHETGHLHGIADEQQADCWGLHWFKRIAADLGATTRERSELWTTLDGDGLRAQWCR